MRAVVQRCTQASVDIEGSPSIRIGHGLLVLLGIATSDTEEDNAWCCQKIIQLRIFDDQHGVMNKSIKDVDGDLIVVSQFTLLASVKKGNRPSYIQAAPPHIAKPMYEKSKLLLNQLLGKPVLSGVFGAHMQVHLTNDGPVTILIDTNNRT